MKKNKADTAFGGIERNLLLRTNVGLLIVFVIGFAAVYCLNYFSNIAAFEQDVEHVATLASESIYFQIDSYFTEPVNVSLTMANDSFMKAFLEQEEKRLEDPTYPEKLTEYLEAYRRKYDYDSVFLVSAKTGRYYHFNGIDRVLTPNNPENEWYYQFVQGEAECALNIDNDEASQDVITTFINCKVEDEKGNVIGVVGVGLKVENMQALLEKYDERFGSYSLLLDETGTIQLSSEATGDKNINLFDDSNYALHQERIISAKTQQTAFWVTEKVHGSHNYMVSQYIPSLKWYLLVEHDTEEIRQQFDRQLLWSMGIMVAVVVLVLWLVSSLIVRFNRRFVRLTVSQELEYQQLLIDATKGMYENVFELDITHGRAYGEKTRLFFESIGTSADAPYEKALELISQKQIKQEYVQGYLDTFSPQNIIKAYQNGQSELFYDVVVKGGDKPDYWLRIRARIFYWASDHSVRMITYRQNIDEEKRHEQKMLLMAQCDLLTGLYNKSTTEQYVDEIMAASSKTAYPHALLMLDIDDFKGINDTYGHVTGDQVLKEVANMLRKSARVSDIPGRIGGDEFVLFLKDIPSAGWVENHTAEISEKLNREMLIDGKEISVSISIGMAVSPKGGTNFEALYRNADSALYLSKHSGKGRYSIYSKS